MSGRAGPEFANRTSRGGSASETCYPSGCQFVTATELSKGVSRTGHPWVPVSSERTVRC
jgi:hypothetical protein